MSTQETTLFDTHTAVKRLTEAGVPVSQAEAVVTTQAEVMLHDLADKQDIESLRAETEKDIHILRAELSRDLAHGLHRQNRFMLTALMGFALLIIASIEVRLLFPPGPLC